MCSYICTNDLGDGLCAFGMLEFLFRNHIGRGIYIRIYGILFIDVNVFFFFFPEKRKQVYTFRRGNRFAICMEVKRPPNGIYIDIHRKSVSYKSVWKARSRRLSVYIINGSVYH